MIKLSRRKSAKANEPRRSLMGAVSENGEAANDQNVKAEKRKGKRTSSRSLMDAISENDEAADDQNVKTEKRKGK